MAAELFRLPLPIWELNYIQRMALSIIIILCNTSFETLPFERGEMFSQRAFFNFTDIRKLQEKAETSYTLITEEAEVLI